MNKFWQKSQNWLALLIFIILTFILTWPLLPKITTSMFAIYGDAIGGLWATWWTKFAIWNLHQLPFKSGWIAAPYISEVPFLLAPVDHFLALIPNILVGPVFAYNFVIVLSFVLSGLGMYFLVRELLENHPGEKSQSPNHLIIYLSAIVAGAIFTFSPYHFVRAWQHWDLAQIQWIPFYVLFLVRFVRRKKVRELIWALVFFALTLGTNAYYALGLSFLTIIFVLVELVAAAIRRPKSLLWTLPLLTVAVLVAFIVYTQVIKPKVASYNQPLRDFMIYSLAPHNYLTPPVWNKYFGARALEIIRRDLNWPLGDGNETEKTAYLGFLPFGLALLGFGVNRRKSAWLFLSIGLFFFALSMRPLVDIGPYKEVPMLSMLLYKIAPFARSVGRYSIFVQFSVSAMAGIGLYYILKFIKFRPLVILIASAVAVLILAVEYQMPVKLLNASDIPPVYQWLKNQPGDFIIMEFPTRNTAGYGWVEHAFYQTYHQKRMFNAHLGLEKTNIPQDKKVIWEAFYNSEALLETEKVAKLKEIGVKYIVAHPNAPFSDIQQNKPYWEKVSKLPYLKLVGQFPQAPGEPFCCGWDVFGEAYVFEISL